MPRQLSLSLRFQRKAAVLWAAPLDVGPLHISLLALRLCHLGSALDLSGRLQRFCQQRSELAGLCIQCSRADILRGFLDLPWRNFGLGGVTLSPVDEQGQDEAQLWRFVLRGQLTGALQPQATGTQQIDASNDASAVMFTAVDCCEQTPFVASLAARIGQEGQLELGLYDVVCLGGSHTLHQTLVVQRLYAALQATLTKAFVWRKEELANLMPAVAMARQVLPLLGWKVPHASQLRLGPCRLDADDVQLTFSAQGDTAPAVAPWPQALAMQLRGAALMPHIEAQTQLPSHAEAFAGFAEVLLAAPRADSDESARAATQLLALNIELWPEATVLRQVAELHLRAVASADGPQKSRVVAAARWLHVVHRSLEADGAGADSNDKPLHQLITQLEAALPAPLAPAQLGELTQLGGPFADAAALGPNDDWRPALAAAYEALAHAAAVPAELRAELVGMAGLLLGERAIERAMALLEQALEAGTTNTQVHATLAQLQLQAQQPQRAERVVTAWLATLGEAAHGGGAEACSAHLAAARLFATHLGQPSRAEEHFAHVLAWHPDNLVALEGRIVAQAARGEPERGRRRLRFGIQQLTQLPPLEQAVGLTQLGQVWQRSLGEVAGATDCFERAIVIVPHHAPALLALADLARERGDIERWVELGEQIVAAHRQKMSPPSALSVPQRVALHLALAEHHLRLPQDDEAKSLGLTHLRGAVDLEPEREAVRLRLEAGLRQVGDYVALAALLVSTGEHAALQGDLERARRWRLQAARLYLGEHPRPHEATRPLEEILRHDPEDAEALALLLPLYAAQNDTRAQLKVLERATESARARGSALAQAQHLLAQHSLLERDGAPDDVIVALLQNILALVPQNLGAASRAVALLQQSADPTRCEPGRRSQLIAALEQLAAAAPVALEQAEALYRLAQLRSDAHEEELAQAAVVACLSRCPHHTPALLLGTSLIEATADPALAAGAARSWLAAHIAQLEPLALRHGGLPLYQRMADLARREEDLAAEIGALRELIAQGGNSRAICERLCEALMAHNEPLAAAQWLESCAEAGWPLEMGAALMRAAELYRAEQRHDDARRVLRAAIALEGDELATAGAALMALPGDDVPGAELEEGLEAQVRAAELEGADDATRIALLEQLLSAQLERGRSAQAEMSCAELLGRDASNVAAHLTLADLAEQRGHFEAALDHRLFAARRGHEERAQWSQARAELLLNNLAHARALAQDIRAALGEELTRLSEASPMPPPLSQQLAAQKNFVALRALLMHQLGRAAPAEQAHLRLRLAQVLSEQLDEPEAALALLRDNLAINPHDIAARRLLVPVYERLGATQALADLHFALSQLEPEVEEALHHALVSAKLFAKLAEGRTTAEQILLTFAQRADLPTSYPALWEGLKELGLFAALAAVLKRGLKAAPDPADGRLAELVQTLAGPLGALPQALAWCERMAAQYPTHDEPFALRTAAILAQQGGGRPVAVDALERAYGAWAEARSGERRAQVLAEQAQTLRTLERPQQALVVLTQACEVEGVDPQAHLQRLAQLSDGRLAQGEFGAAAQAQRALAQALPQGAQADALLRQLASLLEVQLKQPSEALGALEQLHTLQDEDRRWMARLALSLGNYALLGGPRGLCATLGEAELWRAGQTLCARRQLGAARTVLEALLHKLTQQLPAESQPEGGGEDGQGGVALGGQIQKPVGDDARPAVPAVWALIERTFSEAGAVRTLAAWRLGWAQSAPAAWACSARLVALCELSALGEQSFAHAPAEGERAERACDEGALRAAVAQSFADEVLDAACLSLPAHAWPAFCLAARLGRKPMRALAAAALHEQLAAEDPRRRDILATLAEAALAAGEPERTLELCAQLDVCHDARAVRLRLAALRAQGRDTEVLKLLFAEAERHSGAEAAAAWQAAAAEQARQRRYDGAQHSLEQVPGPLRALGWAELAYDIYAACQDAERQAEAAALAAHAAPSAAERAQWLRREASLRWWELDAPAVGQQLLLAAHSQAPLTHEEIDAALLHLEPAQARRRLEEAMVVLPRAAHAPLWRRLASLMPPGAQRNVALGRALECCDDDHEELYRLLSAARSAGVAEVLQPVMCRLAQALRTREPQRAAQLFLEAAGLTPTRDAAPLWVDAAQALADSCSGSAQDHQNYDEARALTRRALGAGVQSVALWRLVWRLLDADEPVRLQAAAGLVAAASVPEDDAVALHLAAAEHAQLGGNTRLALELIEGLCEQADRLAPDVRRALNKVHERTLESAGDIGALVRLWLGVAAEPSTTADDARTVLRRAAYLTGPLLPLEAAHEVFLRLSAADPDDHQATAQLWALMARRAAQHAGEGTQAMMQALVSDIEARLGTLRAGPMRARLVHIAVQLVERYANGSAHATALLGRELNVALLVWQQQGQKLSGSEGTALWQAVTDLSATMVTRLAHAQAFAQQLAVMAHTARAAPDSEREPLLVSAGLLARDLGQLPLAFSLLYDVALANPSQAAAVEVCMAVAREHRRADLLIELLTRRAQRLDADEAACALEEAADWAREGLADLSQMLRLLQAAQALAPTTRRTERLLGTLIQLGGHAHLHAAQQLLVGTRLPAHTLRRLGLALAQALEHQPEGQAFAEVVWEHLAARLPQLPEVKARRLAAARAGHDPAILLTALLGLLGEQHVPCGAAQAGLHAEAATLAAAQSRIEVALEQWCCALSSLHPRPSWLVAARRLAQHPHKLTEHAQAACTALTHQIDHWVAQSRHMLLGQAADATLPAGERLSALALMRIRPRNDATELTQALGALASLRQGSALPDELQRVALSLEAQLLRQAQRPAPLADTLRQLAALLPLGGERAAAQRELGDVLGRSLGDWPRAVACLQAALAEQPGDATLRLATAQALVAANRPHEALPYVTPDEGDGLQNQSTEHLEVLLTALTAAQAWGESLPVARQLLGRQPGHLPALRAQARAWLAQGVWDEARQAHEVLAQALVADGTVASWRRATGRSAVPEAHDRGERAQVLDELAQLAVRREDGAAMLALMREALLLSDTPEAAARRRHALRQACLSLGAWAEAAQLAFDSAQASGSRREAGGLLLAAAELWQSRCGDVGAARRALWQASELAPDEAAIWWQLRGVLGEPGPQVQRIAVAEHLLALVPHAHFDALLWAQLANAFAPEDAGRASALFGQAEAAGGVPDALRGEWCEVAWRAQDHQVFVPLAEGLEGSAEAHGEAGSYVRRLRLAEACLRSKGGASDRRRWLMRVLSHDQPPQSDEEAEALRRLADLCASQPQTHRAALGLYGRLLQHDPLNAAALRIAARLGGALGDVDRAYGLYACLLWLLPEDAEAERFVAACRSQHAAQQSQARHTTKLLVRRVQQALEQLDATGAAPPDSRPRRAFDVAQLLRRDIEEVLAQMLPVPSALARPRALARSPDALALFCFAQSPAYFTLRRHLGAQLEAAGVGPAPQQPS